MDIIGVKHTHEHFNETSEEIDKSFAKLKGKKQEIVVGLELNKNRLNGDNFFGKIAKELMAVDNVRKRIGKNPRIKVIFLDSSHGHEKVSATFKNPLGDLFGKVITPEDYEIISGLMPEELVALKKNERAKSYLNIIARTEIMERKIRSQKPDIIVVGAGHALIIEKHFKTKAKYVGGTRESVWKNYRLMFIEAYKIKRERMAQKRARKKIILPKPSVKKNKKH